MIDPTAETFIVQRQGDQLMIQRIEIKHLTVSVHGLLRGWDGLSTEAPTFSLEGTFAGGGLFDPGDAEQAFVRPSLES